jgi:hypothetical protein
MTSALIVAGLQGGCDDSGPPTGPDDLSPLDRSVVEEIAVDRIMDLFWVADASHGGTLPSLGYAFSLPGVAASILGSATVDPSLEAGLFEPFCDASSVEGVQTCIRLRLYENGNYDFQVYYTTPPDSLPRLQPDLVYAGEDPLVTVRYAPQPLRVWKYLLTPEREVTTVSLQVEERFVLTVADAMPMELGMDGVLEAAFEQPQEVHADLSVTGLPTCASLRITFAGVHEGAAGGEIRCGDAVWAELLFIPGQPLGVEWRD